MLNTKLHLNTQVFDPTVEQQSIRSGFGQGLCTAASKNARIVALSADLSESVGLKQFRDMFAERYIELGVAEQNLATVASGLAAAGKIPFAASYAVFSPGRNWEQIRTTICYNDRAVKLVGTHAGVNVGPDGGSHQALEDIVLMRTLPRMVVLSPCDALEAARATEVAALTDHPTYIRLPRCSTARMTTAQTPFAIGKAEIYYQSTGSGSHSTGQKLHNARNLSPASKVGLIATGPILYQALLAARRLEAEGAQVTVMNLSTIKPLDTPAILKLAQETRALVTIEDHQAAGGMGSAVAEFLAEACPTHMEFIAVKDKFGQSGTPEELARAYGLDETAIYEAGRRVMLRK